MNFRIRYILFPYFVLQVLFRQNIRCAYQFIKDYFLLRDDLTEKLAPLLTEQRMAEGDESHAQILDIADGVFHALHRVYLLRLNVGAPKQILDLGTGAGFFPYCCIFYGHEAMGVDWTGNGFLSHLYTLLGIRYHEQRIQENEFLRVKERFDLVTAFNINFNQKKTGALWQVPEWDFLLTNLSNDHLNIGGRIILHFNANPHHPVLDQELAAFFIKSGGILHGRRVEIRYTRIVDFYTRLPKSIYRF